MFVSMIKRRVLPGPGARPVLVRDLDGLGIREPYITPSPRRRVVQDVHGLADHDLMAPGFDDQLLAGLQAQLVAHGLRNHYLALLGHTRHCGIVLCCQDARQVVSSPHHRPVILLVSRTTRASSDQLYVGSDRPTRKVTPPTMTPASVISKPAAHQVRNVTRDFAAPTRKWAISETRGRDHDRRRAVHEDEGDHRDHRAEAGGDAGGDRCLLGVAVVTADPTELLDRERLEHRVGLARELLGHRVGGHLVDALELVEERELLFLLLRVLLDLARARARFGRATSASDR